MTHLENHYKVVIELFLDIEHVYSRWVVSWTLSFFERDEFHIDHSQQCCRVTISWKFFSIISWYIKKKNMPNITHGDTKR